MSETENYINNIEVVAIEVQFIDVDLAVANNTLENPNSKRGCKETGVPRKKKLRPEIWKRNVAKVKR